MLRVIARVVVLVAALTTQMAFAGVVGTVPIEGVSLAPVTGSRLYAIGGPVDLYFYGATAAFANVLFVDDPVAAGPFFLNTAAIPGTKEALGSFATNTEFVFRFGVLSTGDNFFSGFFDSNPDFLAHIYVTPWTAETLIPVNGLFVGLEDILGGGDEDYNDLMVVMTGIYQTPTGPPVPPVVIPEPATVWLLGAGLLLLAGRAAAKARRSS